ncbi:hypothetical protein [Cardinium endosymbiont of Oedothorax gibbosus]|uniref:hypothetical protein n=1 Tax=Cardinium endosymbiont of Oedothorax gibbosus TaxID=931101 RepID=UPI002024744F|nr:hypothetical protein [Cardinium endosymbiont of Oedothorax gibbosus]CAH2560032.1 hypothetical protein CAOEGIBSW744_0662 [Cardinium endosymbiont of Oedothorax gibbosus]
MKKKIFPLLLFFVALHVVHPVSADDVDPVVMDTQEIPADTYVPLIENYPSFMVEPLRMDYVYNLGSDQSKPFDKVRKFDWHSLLRGNVALLYAIRINQSRFAFCPGIGWSTLYYAFALEHKDGKMTCPTLERESESQTIDKYLENDADKKFIYSAFKISFVDLLLRLRFNSVLDEPKAGFHAWLGVKLGIRRSAFTIVDYKEYGHTGALKCKGDFNFKPWAFAVQAGVGYHRFGLVGGFHLTPLFRQNQGPPHSDSLRPFSFGIYIDLV